VILEPEAGFGSLAFWWFQILTRSFFSAILFLVHVLFYNLP
jgi:hypothetical protein